MVEGFFDPGVVFLAQLAGVFDVDHSYTEQGRRYACDAFSVCVEDQGWFGKPLFGVDRRPDYQGVVLGDVDAEIRLQSVGVEPGGGDALSDSCCDLGG